MYYVLPIPVTSSCKDRKEQMTTSEQSPPINRVALNLVHEDHQQGGARIENCSQRLGQARRFVFDWNGGNKVNIWPRCSTDEFSFFFVLFSVQSVEEDRVRFIGQHGFRFDFELMRLFSSHRTR